MKPIGRPLYSPAVEAHLLETRRVAFVCAFILATGRLGCALFDAHKAPHVLRSVADVIDELRCLDTEETAAGARACVARARLAAPVAEGAAANLRVACDHALDERDRHEVNRKGSDHAR